MSKVRSPGKAVALIAGPTASGKSDLAVELALALGRPCVVINADSAQVYRDLKVLSARPSEAEMRGVEHRLFGEWDGAEACSAADWASRAKREIEDAQLSGALEAADPARYLVTQLLHSLRNGDLAQTEEFAGIFAAMFSEITLGLKKGARVEAVIDVIEALDESAGLRVDYPADCRECTIAVEGVEAQVRCTGATLDIVFPRAGSPRELMAGFAAVRGAFAVSKDLAGLLE